ncbi:hypothetical protein LRY65_03845 [Candidatus Woesebacteria bacterium]|nr:hypothetical protein [Candidatus Woesebacteria bacterium]MCD8507023.1 hypothetical protein [Candidatus Woesebacteria bacterium]MCD8527315.1 hypothetical protein [Candidatus Woesebacteria bacterium]MCD8546679.1 hypothetical protein [Candidatus Woesebacteria bacterium]
MLEPTAAPTTESPSTTSFLSTYISPDLISYLEAEQKRLIKDSLLLLSYFADRPEDPHEVHDFAFVVFPLAKAYEGFLKTYFYRHHLISEDRYRGRYFRIGRSFNPDLPQKYRDEDWVYDDVTRECSEELAREMWNVWLDARNHLFHYFPDERYDLTLEEAEKLVHHALDVMTRAVRCGE